MKDHAGSLRTINGDGIVLYNLDGVSTQRLHISCIMHHGDHWYRHAQPLPICSAVSTGWITGHIILEEILYACTFVWSCDRILTSILDLLIWALRTKSFVQLLLQGISIKTLKRNIK